MERGSAESQSGIETQGSPAHARACRSCGDDGRAGGFRDPAAQMHAVCPTRGRAHARDVCAEGVGFCFLETTSLPRIRSDGRHLFNGRNHLFHPAFVTMVDDRSRPGVAHLRLGGVRCTRHVPDVFARLPVVDDLESVRNVFLGQVPVPCGSISQDNQVLGLQQQGDSYEMESPWLLGTPCSNPTLNTEQSAVRTSPAWHRQVRENVCSVRRSQ
jgi:hypothetical protein